MSATPIGQPSVAAIAASTSSSVTARPWRSRSSSSHSLAVKLSSVGPSSTSRPAARSLASLSRSGRRVAIASDNGAPRTFSSRSTSASDSGASSSSSASSKTTISGSTSRRSSSASSAAVADLTSTDSTAGREPVADHVREAGHGAAQPVDGADQQPPGVAAGSPQDTHTARRPESSIASSSAVVFP